MKIVFLGLPHRERLIYFTEAAIRRTLSPEFLGLPDARLVFALRWKRGQSPSFSKATSTNHRKKLQKKQDDLKKQQTELLTFEEKLKYAADKKISLDLDDGVKVNFAKFGDLLAESRAICGIKDDDG